MKRALISLAALFATLAIAGTALAATGTPAAAKGPAKINAVTAYALGSGGGFCSFRVVVHFSGKPRRDTLTWYLTTDGATGDSASWNGLGSSPFTGQAGFSIPPPAGTYHFLVQIKNHKGDVISKAKTSTFSLTGACPAAGKLGTYKRK